MGRLTDSYNKWRGQQGENSAAGSNTSTGDEEKKVTVIGKAEETEEDSGPKNVGGFGGGLEYLGTKFVDGLVSNIEGIYDFVAGGIAEIRGNDEKAQEIFQNDWYNYNRADEKYNPGTGMKVAGDLTGVLGGAVPDIGLGLVLAAAGASTGLAMLLGAGLSFTSGSGRGINEAVNKTGELGKKEWAGGMGSGALAAGIELASGAIGAAAGKTFGKATTEIGMEIGESLSKKASSKAIGGALGEIAEEGSEATAKNIIKKIFTSKTGKELAGEMISEGIEESIETIIDPVIQQNTYNPNASNASASDIGYSFLLGAAGGGLIKGGQLGINTSVNTIRGGKISADSTKMNNLMHNAQAVSSYESEKQTGSEVFQAVTNLYNEIQQKLGASGGKPTKGTMEKIGELDRMVTTAVLVPSMVNAAKGIAQNAQSTVDALNNFYKKTGQDSITVEQLTAGLVMDKGGKAFVRSVEKAMSTNGLLRSVVINNMLGRMEFDAQSFANSIYGDIDISSIATQQNLNRFLSIADAATINQLGAALGISNWAAVTPEDLKARIKAFRDSGQAELHRGGYEAIEKAKRAKGYTNGMPTSVSALRQGATRFKTDKADFAIIREGDKFRLYDFETGHVTNAMSLADMEAIVARLRQRAAEIDAESEMAALDRELNDFANENVPEYKKLTEAEKEAVRATLRSARANGISVKDQILFARIAAKSGLNIIVEPNLKGNNPARYDGRNTVYINASAPRTRLYSGLLGHEVFHKMFKSSKIKRLFMQAWNNIDEGKRQSVINRYMSELEEYDTTLGERIDIANEEVAAAYAEEIFNNPGVWDYILSEEPSLKDRVIAFFKGAPKRYSFAPEMDAAAKKWIGEYKKLFDQVAARNAGMNVVEDVTTVERKEEIKKIGKLVDELGGTATQVPKKVIKKIGKLVPDENAESNKKTASGTKVQDSGERFAIQNIVGDSGTNYGIGVYLDSTLLSGLTEDERIEMVKEYVKELGGKAFTAYDSKNRAISVYIAESNQKFRNKKGKNVPVNKDLTSFLDKDIKQEAIALVDELIISSKYDSKKPANYSHGWLDNHGKNDWEYWETYIQDKENTIWKATLNIVTSQNGDKILYDIFPIEKVEQSVTSDTSTTTHIIPNSSQNVNTSGKNSSKDFDSGERFALSDKKAEAKIEKQKIRLKAEYETDTVFSEAGVKKRLAAIDGYKALPASERSDIESRIWTELNESDGYDAREWIGLNWTTKLTDRLVSQKGEAVSRAERYEIYKQVDDTIRSIIGSGKESVRGRMESEIRKKLPDKIKAEANAKNDIRAEIYQTLKKIDDKKTGRFASASEYKGRTFKGSIENLTKMDWRGKLNDKIVRREMGNLNQWYDVDNPMLKDFESKELNTTPFQESIKRRLEILADGEGELSVEELQMLSEVMTYFTKLMDEYDMVYTEGKWQSGTDIVYKYRDTIEKQKKIRLPMFIRVLRNRLLSGDLRAFGDPLSIMKIADLYEDGIFTRIYNDWLWGEINAGAEVMDIKSEYDSFMQDKNNKNYLAKAKDQKVELHGVKIDKLQLISYIMTLKRKGSWLGVAHSGVKFVDETGKKISMVPITPINPGRDFNQKLEQAINAEREIAERLLSEKDKQYMAILERGFERSRQTKAAGDMQRLGFVNVVEGYYYPIRRAYTEHMSEFEAELITNDRYANASFNKKSVEDAKSALLISSADSVFNSHVNGVARYMYLSPVIDSFNKLFKLKVLKTKPGIGADLGALYQLQDSTFGMQSLIEESDVTWRQNGKIVGFDYLQNLMLDTMGRKNDKVGSDLANLLRGGYVSFALGGNVKVLATQFSSLIASRSILKFGTHLQGITLKGRDVDTYSTVAKLRDSDYDLLKTMGVTDRVNNFAKWFSRGMSFMDRVVVKRVFAAAQAQVARKGGPKIGTEENLIAAGKLTDKIILETQQNAFASRKTEAARRGNDLYKTAMMFKSDSVTMMGRVIDAYGEMQYLKSQLKGENAEGKKKINAKIKKVNKSLNKAVGSVVGSAIFMLFLGEAFKHLYGKADKDETEEERARRLSVEFVGNLAGGIPALSTIMETVTSGYDLESMEFSAINDILGTAKDAIDLAADAALGKAEGKDLVKMGEKLVYTVGQATGIPARNLKNLAWGVTNIISGKTAYKWNDLSKSQSYSKDLSDAIDGGDYDLAAVIVELGFGDKMGSGLSDKAIGELVRLGKTGEKVIPSAVSDKITVDGEEIELSGKELKAVREKYGEAVDMVNMIIESEIYGSFDDEAKADAVNKIYTLYKNLAYDSVIGSKKDEEAYILSKIVEGDILCLNELAYMQPSDKDEKGNTISGSKRGKVVAAINGLDISEEEKLLLIATHGYGLKDGDVGGMNKTRADRVLFNYIASLGLTEEEMLKLYEYAGYDVENGEASGSIASGGSSSGSSSRPTLGGSRTGSRGLGGGGRLGSSGGLGGGRLGSSGGLGSTTKNRVKRLGKLV